MKKLEQCLKQNKLRLTQARQLVFDILTESPNALSAQDVCERIEHLEGTTADQASVYRNLLLFSKIGLVHKLESGRYSVCQHRDEVGHKHMHIVASCGQCGKTYEVDSHSSGLCELSKKFKTYIKGFSSFSGITLQGSCKSCSLIKN